MSIGDGWSEEGSFRREPWTSSTIQGSPDPAKPYISEPVFEGLEIDRGLEIVPLAGRLFVMERGGKIWSFPEEESGAKAELFADLKSADSAATNSYSFAFHPEWRRNRTLFVVYTVRGEKDRGTRLSRFLFTDPEEGPPRLEPDSEQVMFTWRAGGHNGSSLQFGPDGYLYISTGDATEPEPPDRLNTGQDNSDLLSCILRIDVDGEDDGIPYRIPPGNPFVGEANVRPEIWAFGFRNPWRMSFDSRGRLWAGDVGWELWEMIHLVERGGNYGWSAMEASNPIKPETANRRVPISAPVAAHPHTEAASITGGYEYRGSRLPELRGAYIYGDYETGMIWALRHDGGKVVEHRLIADTPHRISTFGLGNDGELYYIHYGEPCTFHRLVPNPAGGQSSDFPRKLSETGLFRDVAAQAPARGVYEFEIREPMWEDGAGATRFVALPGDRGIETVLLPRPKGRFKVLSTTWPEDSVLARTVRLGEAPVETQVLHFDGVAWNGYSYRWNGDGTDAELVGPDGDEFDVSPDHWQGGGRYRIASRAECLRCHNMWNKFTPAFEPMQLAGFPAFPGKGPREVAVGLGLANEEYFIKDEEKGSLVSSRGSGEIETRARSWLHANCAHCHRRHGGGSAPLEVNFDRELSEARLLGQEPTRGDFGLSDARIVSPGRPWSSILNYRVAAIGSGHMPPLGSREIDEHGARLLWDWVAGMTGDVSNADEADGAPAGIDDTSPAMRRAHALATRRIEGDSRAKVIEEGLASTNMNIRALFERFRPPGERPVPSRLDPTRVRGLAGDATRGKALLSPEGKLASCFACHRIGGAGGNLGPDLSQVGGRLNREQLLESLVLPSKTIAPEFRLWMVETAGGDVLSGFLRERTDALIRLESATGQTCEVRQEEVKTMTPQAVSLMPEGLLSFLTEQEIADLLAYLAELK